MIKENEIITASDILAELDLMKKRHGHQPGDIFISSTWLDESVDRVLLCDGRSATFTGSFTLSGTYNSIFSERYKNFKVENLISDGGEIKDITIVSSLLEIAKNNRRNSLFLVPLYLGPSLVRIGVTNNETFRVILPDFTGTPKEGNNKFIRFASSENQMGIVQTDEIRPIKGSVVLHGGNEAGTDGGLINTSAGVFKSDNAQTGYRTGTVQQSSSSYGVFAFDANISYRDDSVNPMASHANGSDIHPANIALPMYLVY